MCFLHFVFPIFRQRTACLFVSSLSSPPLSLSQSLSLSHSLSLSLSLSVSLCAVSLCLSVCLSPSLSFLLSLLFLCVCVSLSLSKATQPFLNTITKHAFLGRTCTFCVSLRRKTTCMVLFVALSSYQVLVGNWSWENCNIFQLHLFFCFRTIRRQKMEKRTVFFAQ